MEFPAIRKQRRSLLAGGVFLVCLSVPAAFAAVPGRSGKASPASAAKLSYEKEVLPILRQRCYACHGNGSRLGGFQIDSRAGLLTGSQNTHPVVIPGKGAESFLIRLVSGQVPGKIMPPKGAHLSPTEIGTLRSWIDQGVSFGASDGAAAWKPPLEPRRPALPAAPAGVTDPIDRLLVPYFRSHKTAPLPVVSDRAYARRVYLDLIGLPPTPDELHAFLADRSPDRRTALAKKLLTDDRRYAEHWITFWNDLLRNDYTGTGYIDGGRSQITPWLYNALASNMPYDQFVRELVNPSPESAGFVKGIVWRGVVNASQTPQMQAAQNISQVFMGVNLKCASCHNSFISTWKLADSYGMAGIYAEQPLEMVRCDRPTGDIAPIKFLYPDLGAIDGTAPREKRMEQLAQVLTAPKNGRLARTLVNRIWGRLMGHGLVEPADEMDNRPWDPDLLDWLASDFTDHGYNVRRLLEQIVTSRAYQLPPAGLPSEQVSDFHFTGPVVKRLSAEQFTDSVSALTGVWSRPASQFQIVKGRLLLPRGIRGKVVFQTPLLKSGSADVDVDLTGAEVLSLVVTDGGDGATLDWADWGDVRLVGPKGELRLTDLKWRSATTGYGQVQLNKSVVEKPIRIGDRTFANGIGTHANSVISYDIPAGYTRLRATAGPDTGAVESPNSQTSIQMFVVIGDRSLFEARAALAVSDPLTRALGRPNREQVVTERTTVATTLQALELTNGRTLNTTLAEGAARWKSRGLSAQELADAIYEQALGRLPSPTERRSALELIGTPATKEGIEDLLWAVTMLPEFQLIY